MDLEQKTRGLSKSCALLIVIAGMERYAFKGVASNLVTYLTDVVKMSNSRAAKTVNTWAGFTSMLPLFSAPLADTYWDRFFTILASSSVYFVGLVGLTWTAFAGSRSATKTISSYFLYSSLCLVSIGLGVLNPSLQAFGADQLDHDLNKNFKLSSGEQKDAKATRKTQFFQWWYFGVCTGSLMGVTVMAYIQDTFGWVLGFAIPGIVIFLSILLFMSGCGIYVYAPGTGLKVKTTTTPLEKILRFIKGGVVKQRSIYTLADEKDLDAMELELQERPLCKCETEDIETPSTTTKGLDDDESSKTVFSGIDNVKLVIRLFPIWMMLLMFAVIFQLPATFFTKQGVTMKRNIGSNFKIPPATLQSTITLSIILLMPLYDKILIPITKRIKKNGTGISVMERMGVGMFLSIIAIVIAAIVERKRLAISQKMKTLPDYDPETVPMSIFWLLPQYILLGISDIFTVVGMQEFFYSEVPVRMRTMGFALYTSVFGVGSFVSAALISIVEAYSSSTGDRQNWFADDMSEARLDKYYWLLALTSTISFVVYIVLCKFFKSSSDQGDEKEEAPK
ncbi:MFS transporter superfamily [Arabidopsis thaliana x Arabidopsis arenosa]|uniref:MFS transporter superfamily n=1 Tax=Arabidopsis thaliana x Arabidopsis arenosa TaxID=1240361 RepID=A0A8T2ANH1_9BRAS|nr:MFS transporter superfamily [Arabidopsis thaliana x Arabidopsis arenosa]